MLVCSRAREDSHVKMSNRKAENWWESYRRDPLYGPMPSQRGWLNLLWPFLVLLAIGFLAAISPSFSDAVDNFIFYSVRLAVLIFFGMAVMWVVFAIQASERKEKAAREAKLNESELWFYHRATDVWVPANGPNSFRAWWSLDWNRWLTRDEVESRIPFTTGFNCRLTVYDGRNTTHQVLRSECEVWEIQPLRNKKTVTAIPPDDIGFMHF